jgi:hypothetical protein
MNLVGTISHCSYPFTRVLDDVYPEGLVAQVILDMAMGIESEWCQWDEKRNGLGAFQIHANLRICGWTKTSFQK